MTKRQRPLENQQPTRVELAGRVMGGRADDLDAALVRAVVWAAALKGRQERVVDVDRAPPVAAAELLAENLGEDERTGWRAGIWRRGGAGCLDRVGMRSTISAASGPLLPAWQPPGGAPPGSRAACMRGYVAARRRPLSSLRPAAGQARLHSVPQPHPPPPACTARGPPDQPPPRPVPAGSPPPAPPWPRRGSRAWPRRWARAGNQC